VIPSRVKGLDVSSTQVRNLLHDGRSGCIFKKRDCTGNKV
jgi:hypothetical protein